MKYRTNPGEMFKHEREERVSAYPNNKALMDAKTVFMRESTRPKYSYNFSWLGRSIIQYPQDIVAMQEIIWSVKPDLIIETGIAHGGSLILSASLITILEACEEIENGRVLGIDIDIRSYNREAILAHPMSKKITMYEGSSTDKEMIGKVYKFAEKASKLLVCLDSNHTHEHVLAELNAYAPLVSGGSYCVVFDTVIEDMPDDMFSDRPWGEGNNPKTAVREYLKTHPEFEADKLIENKLLITAAPGGYLKRVR